MLGDIRSLIHEDINKNAARIGEIVAHWEPREEIHTKIIPYVQSFWHMFDYSGMKSYLDSFSMHYKNVLLKEWVSKSFPAGSLWKIPDSPQKNNIYEAVECFVEEADRSDIRIKFKCYESRYDEGFTEFYTAVEYAENKYVQATDEDIEKIQRCKQRR